MRTCEKLFHEIFCPTIAVLTSTEADEICSKNGLTFVQLLAPFSYVENDRKFDDTVSTNSDTVARKLDFRDLHNGGFLKSANLNQYLKQLANFTTENNWKYGLLKSDENETPWYSSFKEKFLNLLEPNEHIFLRAYVGCILVVSTSTPDPIGQINRLVEQLVENRNFSRPKISADPKWFFPEIFKYYILLHDVSSSDDNKAENAFYSLKTRYGANACHLLKINSNHSPDLSLPDPWQVYNQQNDSDFENIQKMSDSDFFEKTQTVKSDGPSITTTDVLSHPLSEKIDNLEMTSQIERKMFNTKCGSYLSSADIERTKLVVNDFYWRGLVPYVERQIKSLNEQVTLKRNVISKSLVSSARRWLTGGGGSSPNLPSMASATLSGDSAPNSTNTETYSNLKANLSAAAMTAQLSLDSVEMQTRRLADLALLFRHVDLAQQLYQTMRKELASSPTTLLMHAQVSEMITLCAIMSGRSNIPIHYVEAALTTYLDMNELTSAVKCVLLIVMYLKCQNTVKSFQSAASFSIRMTTSDDFTGALFLDNAAWCFGKAASHRKAALHFLLAGNRYRKCQMMTHTERCYKLAEEVYANRGWSSAELHIKSVLRPEICYSNILTSMLPFYGEYLSFGKIVKEKIQCDEKLSAWTLRSVPFYTYRQKSIDSIIANSSLQSQKSSISLAVSCHTLILHNFQEQSICRISVQLSVENVNPSLQQKLSISCGRHNNNNVFNMAAENANFFHARPFSYFNCTTMTTSLEPNGKKYFTLNAYCCLPGVYDASLDIFVTKMDDQEIFTLQPFIVTVRSA